MICAKTKVFALAVVLILINIFLHAFVCSIAYMHKYIYPHKIYIVFM